MHLMDTVNALNELGVGIGNSFSEIVDGPFTGVGFVITGKFTTFTRIEAVEFINEKGGSVSNRITEKTNYLLCGIDPGSKLKDATSKGISVINEIVFLKMISN